MIVNDKNPTMSYSISFFVACFLTNKLSPMCLPGSRENWALSSCAGRMLKYSYPLCVGFPYVYFDDCIYNFMFDNYKTVFVVFRGKVIWTVFRQHSISVNYLTFLSFTCIRFKSRVACFLICYLRQSCWDQLLAQDLISCLGCITLNGGINLQCKIWQFFL